MKSEKGKPDPKPVILAIKAATFSWRTVEYPDVSLYYRLSIIEDNAERSVYRTPRVKGMLSHTVPEGVLKPGKAYRWRVRVDDSGNWILVQNRSRTELVMFSVAEISEGE